MSVCDLPPATSALPVRVGIRWSAPVDLDLDTRADSSAELADHKKRAGSDHSNGRFNKDFTYPPPGQDTYEFTQYDRPVTLGELAVDVNLFAGHSPGG